MILLDEMGTRKINILCGDFIMTYLLDFDLKSYKLLKRELINKYGIERQINRHDVVIDEQDILEIIYKDAIHNNKYGAIEMIDYGCYNNSKIKEETSPLYGHTLASYVATIKDIPAICVALDHTLNQNLISLEYMEEYLKQFNDIKEFKDNVINLDLLRNNNYNINFKERKMSFEELRYIFNSVFKCFKVVGKYGQDLNNLNDEDAKKAFSNIEILDKMLNKIPQENKEKDKVLTLEMQN